MNLNKTINNPEGMFLISSYYRQENYQIKKYIYEIKK